MKAAALILLAALAIPRLAAAHARLESSDPAQRATLDESPGSIRLRFNEEIEAGFSKIAVENEKGEPVTTAKPAVAPDDPKLLILELPSLPVGTYTVKFEVLSVDGHKVKKAYPFTVRP